MRLQKLIIQGFKSFKDRTVIQFDEGITGIVGPNGCGKSNIVDALFWVMGEQSAKHLRGNSMKDVIFSGSSKYNPGSWAEVSLLLSNEQKKHIHIGQRVLSPSEIQITRKLYRTGESEYRINNTICRLKDIQEVFMDTGAGAKSYSIIAQGEIERLVQARPIERRIVVEEVAGITKFKYRRKESLRKIEQTEQNLNRLQDLQIEIEKNIRSLQSQAEKAKKAKVLKERIEKNELIVEGHRIYNYLKELRNGKTKLNELKIESVDLDTKKNILENDLESERIERAELAQEIEQFQSNFNELSKQLAAFEERLNFLKISKNEKSDLLEMRKKEIVESEDELQERKKRLLEVENVRDRLEKESDIELDFSEMEQEVEVYKFEYEQKEEQIGRLKEDIEEYAEVLQKLDREIFKNSSKLEEYSVGLQDMAQEIEVLEDQYSTVSSQIAFERKEVNEAEEEKNDLVDQEDKLKRKVEKLRNSLDLLESEFKEKSEEAIKAESKLNSLEELQKSAEGIKEGAKDFLSGDREQEFNLLGNIIQCDKEYIDAVQSVLALLMDAVVPKENDQGHFLNWCEDNRDKSIDYLELNEGTAYDNSESLERLKLGFGENFWIKPFSEILDADPEFNEKINSLLCGYYITNCCDEKVFTSLSSEIKFKAIVSSKGNLKVANLGGGKLISFTNPQEIEQGLLARNNKISELKKGLVNLKNEVDELSERKETVKNELLSSSEDYENIRTRLSEVKTDFASKKSALESKIKSFDVGHSRLEILKNRKNQFSKSRLELLEREEKFKSDYNRHETTLEGKKSAYQDQKIEYENIEKNYSQKKNELLQKQIEAKTLKDRLMSADSQIDDIKKQIDKQQAKKKSLEDMIGVYAVEIEESEGECQILSEKNNRMSEELAKREDNLKKKKDHLNELQENMEDRENQVKELTKKINRLEKKSVEYEIKLEQYLHDEEKCVKNIFEKYRIDLRDVISKFLDLTSQEMETLINIDSMYIRQTDEGPIKLERVPYEFVKRNNSDIKDCTAKLEKYKGEYYQLGEINWQAIEDYERQKKRYDFLKEQEIQLNQSVNDLKQAIEQIDEKSRSRFKEAFEEINTYFKKVFPIIFGGGEAFLEVNGDLNDPECGIDIIAQPPGKKMQNINLMSGGEKALTAVSLIFSIFLVKPSPFCLLDEVDAPLDDANVGRFNELLRDMSAESQFILITHNKRTMEMNDTLYGVTMQEPGISKAVSVRLH